MLDFIDSQRQITNFLINRKNLQSFREKRSDNIIG